MGGEKRYIAVEGPIGVGKTSLARMLAAELGGDLLLEQTDANPFLEKFYRDRKRHALQTQLFFLLTRYQQQKDLSQLDLFQTMIVSDYLFDRDRIFAHINLDKDELRLYDEIYNLLEARITRPDLVILLQARPEILKERIRTRGTRSERDISLEYLEEVVEAYRDYFFYYNDSPLLVVDATEIDFVRSREDFEDLLREIKGTRKGTWYYMPLGSR
ncbi:MAG: deoxyadenosine kinase [Deltaproteobacteria bacterium RBG_16_54_11]|jgi:deoxyadenosine/deoxycytidine kinase|nr:MAG: deoxyadenosine kinase [Deltaproteobacteria bacterium RBG_16_54_11]